VSRLQQNIVANFIGKIFTVIAVYAFIPFYIKFIGIEAYGLIGFYSVLLGIFMFSDVGLSAALNREMARLSALGGKGREMHNLLRTLEAVFWVIAASLVTIIVLSAPMIARRWVNAHGLETATVEHALRLMGVAMAFQLPTGLYQGGLLGLQRQVLLNAILIVMGTLRGVGAILVLWLISPTIEAYFLWQALVNLGQVILARQFLWNSLPTSDAPARFRSDVFHSIWRYSAGMMGIAVLSAFLMQMDKIVVSKLLSLEAFGYYSLAAVTSQVPTLVSGPIMNAVFPPMTQLVSVNNQDSLSELFHRAAQLMSVLVFPVGLVVAAFSREIMVVWTNNLTIVDHTYLLVTLFIIGSIFLALQVVPYSLALAHGWVQLSLTIGIVTVMMIIPIMITLVKRYGAVGGCVAWILINGATTPFYIHFLHRRLLRGEEKQWYLTDVGRPLIAVCLVISIGRWLVRPAHSIPWLVVSIVGVLMMALAAAALSAPAVRGICIEMLKGKRQVV
jgi:O-antigen/teichoic acid export membrane protein